MMCVRICVLVVLSDRLELFVAKFAVESPESRSDLSLQGCFPCDQFLRPDVKVVNEGFDVSEEVGSSPLELYVGLLFLSVAAQNLDLCAGIRSFRPYGHLELFYLCQWNRSSAEMVWDRPGLQFSARSASGKWDWQDHSPSPEIPRGRPSDHPIFARRAKPLFSGLILVSTVMTSGASPRLLCSR